LRSTAQSKRTSIGILCPGNGTGGPWRYVHSILAALDPEEFDITVFCDLPGEYEARPWIKVVRLGSPASFPGGAPAANNVPSTHARPRSSLTRLAPAGVRLWSGYGKQSRRLARLIRQHSLDIFHTQSTGCEESPVAARLAGVGHVIGTFHVDSTYDLHRERSGPGHRLMETISNRCLDAAIAVSHATKRDWVRRTHIPAGRVVTIHNGIDPEKFRRRLSREEARRTLGIPISGLVVGGLGRLEEAKGFGDLISAVPGLLAEFPDLTVLIAGTGPLRERLEAQAVRLGVAATVRFLGFLPDVQPVFDALDVFAFPSLCETLGYALLEAMATEVPAVGSTVGGIPEVIVPGQTGFLVPSRSPEQLGSEIAQLLRSRDLRSRFGASARERVLCCFQERDMVEKTIEMYRRTLDTTWSRRTRTACGGR
jgi:glycosyltransferase involved in cell wall biosynthesis